MPFLSGRPTFTRLTLPPTQATPDTLDAETIDLLNEHAFIASDVGVPLEREIGWVAPDNILDTDLAYERLAYRDASAAIVGLRIDTNKVTPEIRRAVRAQHERAARDAAGVDGNLSRADRADRADAKAQADAELAGMLAEGRFRSSKSTEILWSLPDRAVLLAATAGSTVEALCDQWRQTFGSGLVPQSAGTRALEFFEDAGRNADFDDLRPTRFTTRPAAARPDADLASPGAFGDDPDTPAVPWAASSPEPRDFLGNEFLLWLWWLTQSHEGMLTVTDPTTGRESELALAIHTAVETECAWGYTGKTTVRESSGGAPAINAPELAVALATGKLPRKAGLHIAEMDTARAWSCTLQADRWAVSGVVLPPVEEPFEHPREEEEYRVASTLELDRLLWLAFRSFLTDRAGEGWSTVAGHIREWIAESRPAPARTPNSGQIVEPKGAAEPAPAGAA